MAKAILSFKTPDVFDQLEDLSNSDRAKVEKLAKRFVEWDEYINIEFDTTKGTAKVLKGEV